ncbi:Inner membrane protein YbaL [Thiorhodovibrio winogradskyi]|uniref:Inner membrane protein YbaL n=1 Tax=Thiorhodovibrio winogradskyi TaxID=77007 RepID=A0ABZ0SH02_9GAMM|nr:cation:proton antiporter family protein [Thiorhodovibrio winogradskyi]
MSETIAWLVGAFVGGLIARQLGLPPLVGYLIAGFGLRSAGAEATEMIERLADLGVTLLLFTIGLKLRLTSLAESHVWGAAGAHAFIFFLLSLSTLLGLGWLDVPYVRDISPVSAMVVAFALSFSSTVFAVKVLEDKGEMAALYGTLAIGILIVQDLAAVLFLEASLGKAPTPWALLLLALLPLRRALLWLLEQSGHGELLLLFGISFALGGAHLFEMVQIKGDLGALLLGVLIASHPKAGELAKALLGLKDLFLVGFFLSIGLSAAPNLDMLPLVAALLALLLVKAFLFEQLLLDFRLRARTALLCGLSLASYSEFGLIVAALAVKMGWLSADWLAIIGITLALSLIIASLLNARSHYLYELFSARLRRQERPQRIPVEREIDPGNANAMVVGMGRVGTGAYDSLARDRGMYPVGVDADQETVARHNAVGRHVVQGSATDADFWHRLHLDDGRVKLVLLAMPAVSENVFAAEHLRKEGYAGSIGAIAKFPDDEAVLRAAGVGQVFNLYAEAGSGFAQHVCEARQAVANAAA